MESSELADVAKKSSSIPRRQCASMAAYTICWRVSGLSFQSEHFSHGHGGIIESVEISGRIRGKGRARLGKGDTGYVSPGRSY